MNSASAYASSHHNFDFFNSDPQDEDGVQTFHFKFGESDYSRKYFFYPLQKNPTSCDEKYQFIEYVEKSFQLVHPVLLPVQGFSLRVPGVYYYHSNDNQLPKIRDLLDQLTLRDIRFIIVGITHALHYCFQKNIFISNFSLDSILIDFVNDQQQGDLLKPILTNYINFPIPKKTNDSEQFSKQYRKVISTIIKDKINVGKNSSLSSIDSDIATLVQKGSSFNEFCQHFFDQPSNDEIIDYQRFLNQNTDVPLLLIKSRIHNSNYPDNIYTQKASYILLKACLHRNIFKEVDDFYLLNQFPEHEIKRLLDTNIRYDNNIQQQTPYNSQKQNLDKNYIANPVILQDIYDQMRSYLTYEKMTHIDGSAKMHFKLYDSKMTDFTTKSQNHVGFLFKEDCRDALPEILYHLKKAAKKGHAKAKLHLALHYIKGDIIPANNSKALKYLDEIKDVPHYQKIVQETKSKLENKIKEFQEALNHLNEKSKRIFDKANNNEKPNVLYLLYVAFSFYSGLDGFPVSISESISYYRKAAEKSADCQCLFGGFYLNGHILPSNMYRAAKWFRKAAAAGSHKAKIFDGIMRKHKWRNYLLQIPITQLYFKYFQSLESYIFDDSLIFPTACFLSENYQTPFNYSSFLIRLDHSIEKTNQIRNGKKLTIFAHNKIVKTSAEYKNNRDTYIKLKLEKRAFSDTFNALRKRNILPRILKPHFFEPVTIRENYEYFDVKLKTALEKNMKKLDIVKDPSNQEFCFIQHSLFLPSVLEKNLPVDDNLECFQGTEISKMALIPQLEIPQKKQCEDEANQNIEDMNDSKKVKDISRTNTTAKLYFNSYDQLKTSAQILLAGVEKSVLKCIRNKTTTFDPKLISSTTGNNIENLYSKILEGFRIDHSEALFYSEILDTATTAEDDLNIANIYFDQCPVNYKEAAKYYFRAAKKGNAEAQWKYAQMCLNGLGEMQDLNKIDYYFQKCIDNENRLPEGLLRYGLFKLLVLNNHSNHIDQKKPDFLSLIEESAKFAKQFDENYFQEDYETTKNLTGEPDKKERNRQYVKSIWPCLEAYHHLGMLAESDPNIKDSTNQAIEYYKFAAKHGHIESLMRLIVLLRSRKKDLESRNSLKREKCLYMKYLKFGSAICDLQSTTELIKRYNFEKRYSESEKLIQAGLRYNYDIFIPYHVEFRSFDKRDIKPAQLETEFNANPEPKNEHDLFRYFTNNPDYKKIRQLLSDLNLFDKHVMVMANVLLPDTSTNIPQEFTYKKDQKTLDNNEKAIKFLINNSEYLTDKSQRDFRRFFCKLDKKKAREYKITLNFYKENYRKCVSAITLLKDGAAYRSDNELTEILTQNNSNEYALLQRGKLYLKHHWFVFRNVFFAEKLIKKSAALNCPEAKFQLGKLLYYGYVNTPDFEAAYLCFKCAFFDKSPDHRAGYFLSKMKLIEVKRDVNIIKRRNRILKRAAKFGYRRAISKLGKRYIQKEGRRNFGKALLEEALEQGYKKAKKYLKDTDDILFTDSPTTVSYYMAKEYYYGKILKRDFVTAYLLLKKAIGEDEHNNETRAYFYLSKKIFHDLKGSNGKEFMTQDKSKEYFELSLKSGYHRALFKLGKQLYIYGNDRDKKIGIDLLKLSFKRKFKDKAEGDLSKAFDIMKEKHLSENHFACNSNKAFWFIYENKIYDTDAFKNSKTENYDESRLIELYEKSSRNIYKKNIQKQKACDEPVIKALITEPSKTHMPQQFLLSDKPIFAATHRRPFLLSQDSSSPEVSENEPVKDPNKLSSRSSIRRIHSKILIPISNENDLHHSDQSNSRSTSNSSSTDEDMSFSSVEP